MLMIHRLERENLKVQRLTSFFIKNPNDINNAQKIFQVKIFRLFRLIIYIVMISSINSQSIPNLGKYSMREQHLHNKSQERFSLVENVPLANHRNRNFDETLRSGKRGEMVRSQKRNYNNWSMSSFDKVSWVSERKNWKCYINPQVNKYYT